jgi:Ca2+-binding EF-hand superfamily protein
MGNLTERHSQIYDISIERQQYNQLAKRIPNSLSFDQFITVLRPFMMGYYQHDQLEQAFQILDDDQLGIIHIKQLLTFFTIIDGCMTTDSVKDYIRKFDINKNNDYLSYDQFRTFVLKGIGRDIISKQI